MLNQHNEWMRPPEAAQYLRVSFRTLSEWQRRRMIPFVKMGRKCVLFRRADLDRALERMTIKAAGHERA